MAQLLKQDQQQGKIDLGIKMVSGAASEVMQVNLENKTRREAMGLGSFLKEAGNALADTARKKYERFETYKNEYRDFSNEELKKEYLSRSSPERKRVIKRILESRGAINK